MPKYIVTLEVTKRHEIEFEAASARDAFLAFDGTQGMVEIKLPTESEISTVSLYAVKARAKRGDEAYSGFGSG